MIQRERIKALNTKGVKKGAYVLYWMQASQRAEYNLSYHLCGGSHEKTSKNLRYGHRVHSPSVCGPEFPRTIRQAECLRAADEHGDAGLRGFRGGRSSDCKADSAT